MLTNCCGTVELRKASLLISILALSKVVISQILAVSYMSLGDDHYEPKGARTPIKNLLLLFWVLLSLFYALSDVLLFQGILKENGSFLLPWLILSVLIEIVNIVKILLVVKLFYLIIIVPVVVIDGYFHLVVFSYYLEIKG
ncbi:uncharacterized protein [Choristoneura fumiferana]|uniref:uncharacterized protein n=1 Tax=Choristoneura fumiferana TaxID=7141 RepID=UPI003D15DD39